MQNCIFFMMLIAAPAMALESSVALQDFEKDAKNRPVSKVIALLKDMINQLEKEGEEDEEVYETMGCWCVTNEKAKTKSIADGEDQVETLTASIESLTAQSSKLNTEISNLEEEVKKNTEALEKATAVREKDLAEFTQEEKDTLVTINQLKSAVIALSKAHDAALLKKSSKVGSIDAKKLQDVDSHIDHFDTKKLDATVKMAAEAGLEAGQAAEIKGEELRAQMHNIINNYQSQFVTAFMQVNQKSFEPTQRRQITSFLQASSSPLDQFLQSPDDVPEQPEQYHAPTHAICKICPTCDLCNSKAAAMIHEQALAVKEQHPAHHGFKAPKLAPHIQSLLSKVLNGVDTGLLESGVDESETGNTEYEPASGAIFGTLKQMKENFEIELSQAQQDEAKASDEYDQMKAAKEKEIKISTELIDKKTDELAATDQKNAEDKEMLEDTEASLAADKAFLADLKKRCASMDAEFEVRTKARQQEIAAVSKALAFLNSDEAHDLFTRTFNPVLLQANSVSTQKRLAVAKLLKSAALQASDVRLLRLATKVNMNPAFDKVKDEVNEMVDMLKKEQKEEEKKKDYCIDALNTNERDQEQKERDRDDLNAHIDDLKMTIETLDKEIEVLKTEIDELNVQLERASANRKKENEEFQSTVADQRATQKLLAVALKILSEFYNSALVQTKQTGQKSAAGQAPPPGFKSFEKNAASGGVMGMMQGIIDDAKEMETECVHAEETAQKDYEDFTKDTRLAVDTKTKDMETKSADKATAEADKSQADKDMEATLTELESLINEEADLHKECDFLIKNFEISQAARSAEMESLKQANQIFSGASFKLLLQSYTNSY